jgi:hypothetical protein
MRRPRAHATILSALILAISVTGPLAAQSSETAALRVRVIDAATGLPIEGAQVGFPEIGLTRLANDAGIAQIVSIPPGVRTLEVTMLGYGKATTTFTLEAHALATGTIALTSDPIEIAGLTVTGSQQIKRLRDAGFYDRQRMGFGRQLGPLEIAAINALRPSDFFAKIPSVERLNAGFGRYTVVSRRSCETLGSGGVSTEAPRPGQRKAVPREAPNPNLMAIYLDGVPYHDDMDVLPAEMVEAAEVYVGVQVPMQFSSGRPMGSAHRGSASLRRVELAHGGQVRIPSVGG